MPEDSGNFDIAPLLMLAGGTQMAQMMKRLTALGFDDLTPAFASVMPLLDAKGSRATVLAQKAGVTKQAMSQLVKLLEQRDYVEQVADPTDTRAKVIRLTKRGIALHRPCQDDQKQLPANTLNTHATTKQSK